MYNRVTGGFSPPVPTTPSVRVRTGRFSSHSEFQPIVPVANKDLAAQDNR